MKLAEPFVYVIQKSHAQKAGAFKLKDNKSWLLVAGVQTFEFETDPTENDEEFITLTGEDVIPFIVFHNWANEISQNYLKSIGQGGKHKPMVLTRKAIIENNIETDLTINDIVLKCRKGNITDDDYIGTAELYEWMVDRIIRGRKIVY